MIIVGLSVYTTLTSKFTQDLQHTKEQENLFIKHLIESSLPQSAGNENIHSRPSCCNSFGLFMYFLDFI